jgi:uncharacterized membrane protein YfcA
VSLAEASLLAVGGLVAGVVNTLAGGGSILTVPLLVLTGLPGTLANGTNRVGILVQNTSAAWSFRRDGVSGLQDVWPVLIPVATGSLLGALWVSQLTSETFERVFGVVMLLLLVPTLWSPRRAPRETSARPWPPLVSAIVFLGIGLYGGSVQAGVGLVLVMALSRAGFDLVRANSIKVVVVAVLALVALPVFIAARQVAWAPALVLAAGYALGGALGARIAVRGGERVIRPVMTLAVLAMAGRMLRLY